MGDGITAPLVWCYHCFYGKAHYRHFFVGCTCAAAGFDTDHSSHCDIYNGNFKFEDKYLIKVTN